MNDGLPYLPAWLLTAAIGLFIVIAAMILIRETWHGGRRRPAARVTPRPASRWQDCDWCDPAGNSTSPRDCTCAAPCAQQPMALWCGRRRHAGTEASAEETEREIAAMYAELDRRGDEHPF